MVTDALVVQAINESDGLNRREKRRYVRRYSNMNDGDRGELRGQLSGRIAVMRASSIEASDDGDLPFDFEEILGMLLQELFNFLIGWLRSRG